MYRPIRNIRRSEVYTFSRSMMSDSPIDAAADITIIRKRGVAAMWVYISAVNHLAIGVKMWTLEANNHSRGIGVHVTVCIYSEVVDHVAELDR